MVPHPKGMMDPQLAAILERLGKLDQIQAELGGFYAPTPEAGLVDRRRRPVRFDGRNFPLAVPPAGITRVKLWESEALDCKGFTTVNGYAAVNIQDLSGALGVNMHLVLEGAYNSAFCELARTGIEYVGSASYTFPVVGRIDSLATEIRFRLEGVANPARTLRISFDGVLVAGPLV